MGTDYNILRSKMLAFVRKFRDGSFDMHGEMRPYFREQDIELDDGDMRKIEQIFHEFYFEGILVPGRRPRAKFTEQSGMLVFPRFHTTEYGDMVVSAAEYQPYDPDGYLTRIKMEMPNIDAVIIRYLEECLSCFRRNLLLAAAVMLGCAAEKAVLLLVQAYGASLSGKEKEEYEKETESFIISRKWKALWTRLEPLSSGLPNGLGDDLGTILERVFDIIRATRNEAGHPTGKTVEKETVHAHLLLFPIFCKRIYGLIQLHYQEITRRCLAQGYWRTDGKTPETTVNAQIAVSIKRHGNESPFRRVGRGIYELNPDVACTPSATTTPSGARRGRGEGPRFERYGKGMVGLTAWHGVGLAYQIEQHNRAVRRKLHKKLQKISPGAFEDLIGRLLAEIGFEEVQVTARQGDGGIDARGTLVVGEVIRTRMAVQVKRWKNNVQAPTVQQVRGSLGAHEQGLIITTSDFSGGARTEAERPDAIPVALMNGEQLISLLVENEIGVVKKSHELIEPGESEEGRE